MRQGRKAAGDACQTLACTRAAHLIIKLIKVSIWQCHSCPANKEEEGRKAEFKCCGLWGPHVKGCFSSSAACVWLAQLLGKWRGVIKKKKERKKNRAFISKWQEGVGFWCSKNGSGKINTHQKEQRRNKKGIEGAEETDWDGATSKAPLKPFKVALRLGERGFLYSLTTSRH